jgi:geranyl-CoA carboxylase alpha subunit
MGAAAVKAAASVGYVGAGTVEFLLADDGRFYFLEMNTRIQVEHPVTERVTGVDLVRLQFHVAQGRPLPFTQSDVAIKGHAIEARLYAEDPSAGFLPSTGRIVAWRAGQGEGVRIDSGIESGAEVAPHYDSLLAKVIAFGADREEARCRLVRALQATFVAGVTTNRDFLVETLGRREFVDGEATTAFLASTPERAQAPSREAIALAALLFVDRGGVSAPTASWRASPVRLEVGGAEFNASVRRQGEEQIVTLEGETFAMRVVSREDSRIRFSRRGIARLASFARDGDELWLDFDGACRRFVDRTYAPPQLKDELSDGAVRSPVSGVVVGVEAKAGDRVRRGQALATIEAMKMQYSILAPIAGVVTMANAALGAQAQARALLFAIEPPGD